MRREQLIEVATGLFARLGYDATTTAAIAQSAGISEPVLYRHFPSKQALFVAVVQSLSERSMARWKGICDPPDDPCEQLRQVCHNEYDALVNAPDAYRLFHGVMANGRNEVALAAIRKHFRELEQMFVAMLRAGQKQSVFRADFDPRAMVSLLVATGIGLAMHELAIEPGGVSAKQFADFALRQVMVTHC